MFLESYGQRCNGYCLVSAIVPCNCGSSSRLRRPENDSDKNIPATGVSDSSCFIIRSWVLLRYADFGRRWSRDSSKWD